MAYLVDTNVFITLERRGETLSAVARLIDEEPFALASIVAAELMVGVHRSEPSQRREQRAAFIESILSETPVVSFDLHVARVHASVWAELLSVGQMIGPHDLQIAATARAHGYAVLTENSREFERVPGLVVRHPNW